MLHHEALQGTGHPPARAAAAAAAGGGSLLGELLGEGDVAGRQAGRLEVLPEADEGQRRLVAQPQGAVHQPQQRLRGHHQQPRHRLHPSPAALTLLAPLPPAPAPLCLGAIKKKAKKKRQDVSTNGLPSIRF